MDNGLLSNFRALNPSLNERQRLDPAASTRDQDVSHSSVHTVPLYVTRIPTGGVGNANPGRLEKVDDHFSMIFRRKYERLDWRKIAAIDLENIYKTQDTRTLQDNLTQLAFFDLEQELRNVDLNINPQFVKLFQTMQLSLEYLLYVQDRLQRQLDGAKSSAGGLMKKKDDEIRSLAEKVANFERILTTSKDELRKRKKMIKAQQEIINNVAKGRCHRCPFCEKLFVERPFLDDHFRRKHPGCDSSLLDPSEPDELASVRKKNQELEQLLKGDDGLQKQLNADINRLRENLRDLQLKYDQSQKELGDLTRDHRNLTGKIEQKESNAEVSEHIERRVSKLQETFESRIKSSEDNWKDRFLSQTEEYKRDMQKMEQEMKQKANEQFETHKAERQRLKAANEDQEKRIRELEAQLQQRDVQNQRPPRRKKEPTFRIQQIKIQSNPSNSAPITGGLGIAPRVTGNPTIISQLREDLADALDKKLEEYGIPRGTTAVSDRERDHVLSCFQEEKSRRQGKLAKYGAARSTIENHIRDREPMDYSASSLLDEASKIRVRTPRTKQYADDDILDRASISIRPDVTSTSTVRFDPTQKPQPNGTVGDIPENIVTDRRVTFGDQSNLSPSPRPPRRERFPESEQISTTNVLPSTTNQRMKSEGWFSDDE